MITCGCGASWTGVSRCHCSGCHRTFSGSVLFDRHRSQYGERGKCLDLDGFPDIELRDGIWSYPKMTEAEKSARFGETS